MTVQTLCAPDVPSQQRDLRPLRLRSHVQLLHQRLQDNFEGFFRIQTFDMCIPRKMVVYTHQAGVLILLSLPRWKVG